ncbi:InlB B-repeat-containing protein [Bacteroides cellulosilyticus]|jgi:hypothetical protein|uniref:Bacterial repeat domain-containing protein n=1 Tax=Bacteroides cellulosilyticus TaxID=246787 RepID=A0A412I8M8_9BACE|nr:hypothetical protein [Bacteroides cellulosilyticus]RGS33403.1 hypothetical protein DWX97_22130 [Bacteroides cellulosilyticus]DAJ43897.1 MAG TPA: Putative polysaccharide deacetylase [Caudoviricetes sp.]
MANLNIPSKNTGDTLSASEFNQVVSAVNGKIDSVNGKGLSTNDYTNTDKQSLSRLLTRVDKLENSASGTGGILISDVESKVGSYKFGITEHDIYACTIELVDPPTVVNTEKEYMASDSPLGNNMYLTVKNIIVKDTDGKFYPGSIEIKQIYVSEGFETKLSVLCKSAIPAGSILMLTLEYVKLEGEIIEFSVALPSGVSADDVNLTIAPLKYDKHFAFTYTADDSVEGAYARIWRRINQKWIDDTEFFHLGNTPTTGYIPEYPLVYTDGCGNDRRFGFSIALWPTWGNEYNPDGLIKDSSTNSIYITWNELDLIKDWGVSMLYHNVDERVYDKNNADDIEKGFVADYNKVLEKINRRMKIMGLPDGNAAYVTAADKSPLIDFYRSSLHHLEFIYLKSTGSLFKKRTYGGTNSSVNDVKLEELASQHTSDNPYWVGITTHRVDLSRIELLETIYSLYGKGGDDSLWVASWDEVYEYIQMRLNSIVKKVVSDDTVTWKILVPFSKNYYFKDLSFLVSGITSVDALTVSDKIFGYSYAAHGSGMLVNVNFNELLLDCAEKYTSKFESTLSEDDKTDAYYFVNQLKDTLKAPFVARLSANETAPVLNSILINDGVTVTYDQLVSITLNMTGGLTHYKVGETADLSGASWIVGTSKTFSYQLSSGYASKTVYVQVKNSFGESEVKSSSILYSERPAVSYTVTGKANNTAYGTVTPAVQDVAEGGQASVNAQANDGYVIGGWSGADTSAGIGTNTGNATVNNVRSNKTITCNFQKEGGSGTAGKTIVSFAQLGNNISYDTVNGETINYISIVQGTSYTTNILKDASGDEVGNYLKRKADYPGEITVDRSAINTDVRQPNVDDSGVYPAKYISRYNSGSNTGLKVMLRFQAFAAGTYKVRILPSCDRDLPSDQFPSVFYSANNVETNISFSPLNNITQFVEIDNVTVGNDGLLDIYFWNTLGVNYVPGVNLIEIIKL